MKINAIAYAISVELEKNEKWQYDHEGAEQVIERPYDLWKVFKELGNGSDIKMYKEVHTDGHFKRLCWAELLIVTEENKSKNKTLAREFSIILENPGDISKEDIADEKDVEPYEIWEGDTKKSKILNFTTVRKTDEHTIKEHKTLFCGSGPILTKEYYEWPKLNKKKIEIRLSAGTPTTWRLSNKDNFVNLTETYYTQPSSYNTYDTTETNTYIYTSTTERDDIISEDPFPLETLPDNDNTFNINSNKSSFLSNESGEQSNIMNSPVNVSMAHDNTNDNLKFYDASDNSLVGGQSELLRRMISFRNLKDNAEDPLKATLPNFMLTKNFTKTPFLLDQLFPDKSVFNSLLDENTTNTFLLNVTIRLEHRTVDKADGREKTNSIIEMEEDSVYRIVHKK